MSETEKTASDWQTILYSVTNRVACITLNRPDRLNAFNELMREELLAAVQRADRDDDVRIVIVTHEGRGFSAGADLTESVDPNAKRYALIEDQIVKEYQPILLGIYESDKLFIAAVSGPCAGVGSALAMACDFIVMSDDAYIYQAFAAIGLVPDGGASWHLVNHLGPKRALQAIVEAEKLPAAKCLEYGMVNKVVPVDELRALSQQWAEKLAVGAPIAQRFSKQLVHKVSQGNLANAVQLEAAAQNSCTKSDDARAAMMAFLEKKAPVFVGR